MVSPLIIWFMTPLDPSEIISPTNTLTPLNASELLPGNRVRVGDDEREQPEQRGGNPPRRHGRVGVQPLDGNASLFDRGKEAIRKSDDEPRRYQDDDDGKQMRQVPDQLLAEHENGGEGFGAQGFTHRTRIRKAPEHERRPGVGQQQQHQERYDRDGVLEVSGTRESRTIAPPPASFSSCRSVVRFNCRDPALWLRRSISSKAM